MVSRLNGVQEAAGSSPVTRTIGEFFIRIHLFFICIAPNLQFRKSLLHGGVQLWACFSLWLEGLGSLLLKKENRPMYYKRCTGTILVQKSADFPDWVQWTHHSEGKTHCEECLKLDGCWFSLDTVPPCPHHPFCHCTLDPIDYASVVINAKAYSKYSKFDPYLFNTTGTHPHGKEKLFHKWGYTVDDAQWLQKELERQAREKYISGEYILGTLNKDGQRISIRVTIPKKGTGNTVSFITGWMVEPDGAIRLTTPYGGK